jgi:hypothetical protein
MVPLSERTLQGMRRAYESSLDGSCILFESTRVESPTGRSKNLSRKKNSLDVELPAFACRFDPETASDTMKSGFVEKGSSGYLSLPWSAPELKSEDVAEVTNGGSVFRVRVKGVVSPRSGKSLDHRYQAVVE